MGSYVAENVVFNLTTAFLTKCLEKLCDFTRTILVRFGKYVFFLSDVPAFCT